MDTWLIIFVGLTALAILLQAIVLTGTYRELRRLNREVEALRERFDDRVDPLLDRLDDILKTVQVNTHRILGDITAVTEAARAQGEKLEHALTAPIREAAAVVAGIRTALETLAQRRREREQARTVEGAEADEELFI